MNYEYLNGGELNLGAIVFAFVLILLLTASVLAVVRKTVRAIHHARTCEVRLDGTTRDGHTDAAPPAPGVELVKCPGCGASIATIAPQCASCGHDMRP